MDIPEIEIIVQPYSETTSSDLKQIDNLAKDIFGDISEEEIEEDFYAPKFAVILAKSNNQLIGYSGLYKREVEYYGEKILLGGLGGLMTNTDYRGKGVATQICKKAIETLENEEIDVAFHSIDTEGNMNSFYEKLGFALMKQPFSWKSKNGELKSDMGGMIRPIKSKPLYELIHNGSDTFYVGEGYW